MHRLLLVLLVFWPFESMGDAPKVGEETIEFRDVAGELRCPTCTGLSVLDSSAEFSVQIKSIVKEQMDAGKTKDEILSFFVERYGPWILRSPPKTGFNSIAWLVPLLFLIAGPPLVWFFFWRRRPSVAAAAVRSYEEIADEMKARIELARRQMGGK